MEKFTAGGVEYIGSGGGGNNGVNSATGDGGDGHCVVYWGNSGLGPIFEEVPKETELDTKIRETYERLGIKQEKIK